MKRSEIREEIFKLLFRTEFNDISEMPDQIQYYFSVDVDTEIGEKDKEYIISR